MRWLTSQRVWIIGGTIPLLLLGVLQAWHGPGHDAANRVAAASLGKEMPAFFTDSLETIAHCSADPDLFRLRAHPELRDGEVPEHYFDMELLAGEKVPPTRYAFVALCAKKGLRPKNVGCLPYAIVEWTQRLTIAFAEHRKWPENRHVQAKCLVYAGILSHYAQDACQPLHTTIHFDGRANKDGSSPGTGIHGRVDPLLQKLKADPKATARSVKPVAFDELLPAVVAEIKRSHALVEKVYHLEKRLPPPEQPLPADPEVARFTEQRLVAAAEFTASLFLTAWRKSAELKLPEWHSRPLASAK